MNFNDHLIPIEEGQAVSAGWTSYCPKPAGVTWHWTATWDLETCRKILGGSDALRKGEASAHFGVGSSFMEGVDRYVKIEDRSWHAGANQVLRWDGKPVSYEGQWWSGARTTIGIETVNIGYARAGVAAESHWLRAVDPTGRMEMRIQPWSHEQVHLMIELGRYIQERYPHLTWRDHHGHHDISPGYKVDVCAFPMAKVLRGIYGAEIPDIWSGLWSVKNRQIALVKLGYSLGTYGSQGNGVDGSWGRMSDAALRAFQRDRGLVENGCWTQEVNYQVHLLKPGWLKKMSQIGQGMNR